ncbi:sigma-70 family RNA polymerase sigma factor [Streptosporangium sp. NPDC000396]|uniref:sigma-70 family RNA polymerase sigma factor n=1 Tax=Streptosporangium sp. NPDC000396 TaxID=3366185 RepID=UPI003698DAA1
MRLDDETTLRAVYDDYGGELFAFARRSLGDTGLAEDAVQETFVRAWRTAGRYDHRQSSPRTWLFAICRNVVIDLMRARSVRPQLSAEQGEDLPAGNDLEGLLLGMQVEEALRRLSPEQRHILVEVHLRDRAPAEVAAELRIPSGTVRSRVFYALKALRLVLEEMGWDGD